MRVTVASCKRVQSRAGGCVVMHQTAPLLSPSALVQSETLFGATRLTPRAPLSISEPFKRDMHDGKAGVQDGQARHSLMIKSMKAKHEGYAWPT